MSAPLDFLKIFAGQLRQAGISFAITSGMACVHYGLQQTTKDSDWVFPAADLVRLRELFERLEGELPPWRISYRQICGAPLESVFMENGWTSHLSIWDSAGSVEHKVDIFSRPPRVRSEEMQMDEDGWATQHVVAQMKKTDREKDWPIVHGLGRQMWERGEETGLLHLNNMEALLEAWGRTAPDVRERMSVRRPLLRALEVGVPALRFQRLLLVERLIWQRVNYHRHLRYTSAWKHFYRAWRRDPDWEWPTSDAFSQQHQRLLAAARAHDLARNPLAETTPEALVGLAVGEVRELAAATPAEVAEVLPPVYELLP